MKENRDWQQHILVSDPQDDHIIALTFHQNRMDVSRNLIVIGRICY